MSQISPCCSRRPLSLGGLTLLAALLLGAAPAGAASPWVGLALDRASGGVAVTRVCPPPLRRAPGSVPGTSSNLWRARP